MARPTEALIDRTAAVQVALRMLDEHGEDVVSMRKLAKELGVAPASLYHHFSNKEELLDEVARLILREVKEYNNERVSWRRNLERQVLSTLDTFCRHPNAMPLLVRMPHRRFGHRSGEQLAKHVLAAGVPAHLVLPLMDAVYALVIGTAMDAVNEARAAQWGDTSWYPNLDAVIRADRLSRERRLAASVQALVDGWLATFGGTPAS